MGWASAQVGEDPSGNGVAVEVWSRAIKDGKPAGQNPYFRWVFPYVKTRLSGDRVIENGLLATTFEGFGLGNMKFRSGIDQTWRWPAATDRPYLYAREAWAPTGLRGFYTWPNAPQVNPDTDVIIGADSTQQPDDLAGHRVASERTSPVQGIRTRTTRLSLMTSSSRLRTTSSAQSRAQRTTRRPLPIRTWHTRRQPMPRRTPSPTSAAWIRLWSPPRWLPSMGM